MDTNHGGSLEGKTKMRLALELFWRRICPLFLKLKEDENPNRHTCPYECSRHTLSRIFKKLSIVSKSKVRYFTVSILHGSMESSFGFATLFFNIELLPS